MIFYDVSYFPYLPINYFVLMECLTSFAKRNPPANFHYDLGGLTAPTVWVFGGHFVVSAPRIVQIPLQLWQIPAFCREKSRSHGETTEIGTLAFCSGSIGCPEKHENFYDFARMYSTCSSNFRKKRQAPVETATLWAGVLLFPLHMAEDTSREVLKRTFEQKSFWVFVLCF